MKPLNARLLTLTALAVSILMVGCGGGGSGSNSTTGGTSISYSAPTDPSGVTASAPIIVPNSTLSTTGTMVFDVVANSASSNVRGVVCNLQVDPTKLTFVPVPNTTNIVDCAGFGGSNTQMQHKILADGTNLMVTVIRGTAPAQAASGCLMRFALKVVSGAETGVVRTQVMSNSGMTDSTGRLIQNTSPVLGRVQIDN